MVGPTRSRRRLGVLSAVLTMGVVAVLLPAATAAPAAIADTIRLSSREALDPDAVRESVAYLVRQYGVSQGEALRRLELQRISPQLAEQLARAFPDTYGGMWLDQAGGGVLYIRATSPDQLAPALQSVPDRAHVRVVGAGRSLRELRAEADRIVADYGGLATVDEVNNVVVINVATANAAREVMSRTRPGRSAAASTETAAQFGQRLRSGLADRVAAGIVKIDYEAPHMEEVACTIRGCDPPMRGGARLYIYDNLSSTTITQECTNGFNVGSESGAQWTVTAGHCLDQVNENYTKHNGRWVGAYNSTTFTGGAGSYPFDGAITPYVSDNDAFYWTSVVPQNRVWTWDDPFPEFFAISGMYHYDQIAVGWVACAIGSTTAETRCGQVVERNGGIVMNICSQGGDSGGPLYSQVDGRAYGITTAINANCSRSYYSPLSNLFRVAAMWSGQQFWVNTPWAPNSVPFLIHNDNSEMCLVVRGTASGNPAVQTGCSNLYQDQQWQLIRAGVNDYLIQNINSGRCLVVQGTTSGNRAFQVACNLGFADQHWRVDISTSRVQLQNRNSGKCLVVQGTTSGAAAFQAACNGAYADQWWYPTSIY